jgi:hypothetical protein
MSEASRINDTFPLIAEMLISLCLVSSYPHLFFFLSSTPFALPLHKSSNETFDQSRDASETVALDESKKFKIININQATFLDGPGSKFEHKAQLIEIDKLLINTSNGPKQNKASTKIGVWHQVSVSFLLFFHFAAEKLFLASHLMNVAALLRSKHGSRTKQTLPAC